MDIDIDLNEGGDCYWFQLADDRIWLAVAIDKLGLEKTRNAIAALAPGQEAVFGAINCGERVWICRDELCYYLAIADTDSKDVCYRVSKEAIDQVLKAEVA